MPRAGVRGEVALNGDAGDTDDAGDTAAAGVVGETLDRRALSSAVSIRSVFPSRDGPGAGCPGGVSDCRPSGGVRGSLPTPSSGCSSAEPFPVAAGSADAAAGKERAVAWATKGLATS